MNKNRTESDRRAASTSLSKDVRQRFDMMRVGRAAASPESPTPQMPSTPPSRNSDMAGSDTESEASQGRSKRSDPKKPLGKSAMRRSLADRETQSEPRLQTSRQNPYLSPGGPNTSPNRTKNRTKNRTPSDTTPTISPRPSPTHHHSSKGRITLDFRAANGKNKTIIVDPDSYEVSRDGTIVIEKRIFSKSSQILLDLPKPIPAEQVRKHKRTKVQVGFRDHSDGESGTEEHASTEQETSQSDDDGWG
ncbi:MAG: hypothetical protein Q9179_003134 [Wetmoreana sp. 5 TL-2023]